MTAGAQLGTSTSQLGNIQLGLGADSSATYVLIQMADDTLELTDGIAATVEHPTYTRAFEDVLEVTDSIEVTQHVHRVILVDTLDLSHGMLETGPKYEFLHASFALQQQLDVQHLAVIRVTLTDALVLSDVVGKRFAESIHDILTLSDQAMSRTWAGLPDDPLVLSDSIVAQVVRRGADVLNLIDQIQATLIASRYMTHTLDLNQSLTYILMRSNVTQQYMPFVGTGPHTDYTPPTTVAPTLGHAHLTLTYPFLSPAMTVVLRNPEFGNLDRLTFSRINRKTRGGTLVIFGDPRWPKVQTLQVRFTWLNTQQAADLLIFLRTSLGKEIGLLDYEDRQWRGIITTPDAEISNPNRDDYSVGFDFEGVLA